MDKYAVTIYVSMFIWHSSVFIDLVSFHFTFDIRCCVWLPKVRFKDHTCNTSSFTSVYHSNLFCGWTPIRFISKWSLVELQYIIFYLFYLCSQQRCFIWIRHRLTALVHHLNSPRWMCPPNSNCVNVSPWPKVNLKLFYRTWALFNYRSTMNQNPHNVLQLVRKFEIIKVR